MCVYMHMYIYIYIYSCVCMYIDVYMNLYTYTYYICHIEGLGFKVGRIIFPHSLLNAVSLLH